MVTHFLATVAVAAVPEATGATAASSPAETVTALADLYVAEFKDRFPIQYTFTGLPGGRNDGVDINTPAEIAEWHAVEKDLYFRLHEVRPESLVGRPEWVTWHYLNQALAQDAKTLACRSELWSVSPLGWQAGLSQLAGIQPVDTEEARRHALARWRGMAGWIDQEIANLQEGQRLGYLANKSTVQVVIEQLDGIVNNPPAEAGYLSPAERAGTPAFVAEWNSAIGTMLMPAIRRYRDFLRDEYLPRARAGPSIEHQRDGGKCYRGLIFAAVTVDRDPDALFDAAVKQVARERSMALALGKKLYGDKATDWISLSKLVKADPKNRFATAEELRGYTLRTYGRAYAAAGRMVLTPPVGQVRIEPFPEFQQTSAPSGQYLPAADDGSRVATYFYRNTPNDLYRASLQLVILHETLPGHHLQVQFLAEHGRKASHPITRLMTFNGPMEGWATYAEAFADEIGLYDSNLESIGRQMDSMTPMMVADLGMQVRGWSIQQATDYLREAMPLRPPGRVTKAVAMIIGSPGFFLAYPLGGNEWRKMRDRAQASLGKRFDVRAFHQIELEDGMLPFPALESKLDAWVKSGGPALQRAQPMVSSSTILPR